jgi:hypothetical protein
VMLWLDLGGVEAWCQEAGNVAASGALACFGKSVG